MFSVKNDRLGTLDFRENWSVHFDLRFLSWIILAASFIRSTRTAANLAFVVSQSCPGSAPQKGQPMFIGLTAKVEGSRAFMAHATYSPELVTTGKCVSPTRTV